MSADFDSLVTLKEGVLEVIVSQEFSNMAKTLILAQIKVRERNGLVETDTYLAVYKIVQTLTFRRRSRIQLEG